MLIFLFNLLHKILVWYFYWQTILWLLFLIFTFVIIRSLLINPERKFLRPLKLFTSDITLLDIFYTAYSNFIFKLIYWKQSFSWKEIFFIICSKTFFKHCLVAYITYIPYLILLVIKTLYYKKLNFFIDFFFINLNMTSSCCLVYLKKKWVANLNKEPTWLNKIPKDPILRKAFFKLIEEYKNLLNSWSQYDFKPSLVVYRDISIQHLVFENILKPEYKKDFLVFQTCYLKAKKFFFYNRPVLVEKFMDTEKDSSSLLNERAGVKLFTITPNKITPIQNIIIGANNSKCDPIYLNDFMRHAISEQGRYLGLINNLLLQCGSIPFTNEEFTDFSYTIHKDWGSMFSYLS